MWRAIILLIGLAAAAPGIASTLYVSASGDDSDGSTPQKAFRSVTKAVTKAASGDTISIAAGRYTEAPLMLTKSLTLSGPSAPEPSATSTELPPLPPIDTLCAKQACITSSGDRVINISAGTAGPPAVTLANLVILGPDMSAQRAQSSFGIVADGVPVNLKGVMVVAGVGGPGAPGLDGPAAQPDDKLTSLADTGHCWVVPEGCGCAPGQPGKSRYDSAGKVIAAGGSGGPVAYNYCPGFGVISGDGPPNGAPGGPGDAGPHGIDGLKANPLDAHWIRTGGLLMFSGSTAGGGGLGTWGADGGGGGPGGTRSTFMLACDDHQRSMGGPGGWGGGGGEPGQGGSGGGQGGGAFGVVVSNANLDGTLLSVYGGKGGVGGAGGQGGAGAAGAKGHDGKPGWTDDNCRPTLPGGTGGKGGDGGAGGAGGGGAGGDGGPSIDVVLIGTSKLGGQLRVATRAGTGGIRGAGGAAGPKGPLAESGAPGKQASTAQFDLR